MKEDVELRKHKACSGRGELEGTQHRAGKEPKETRGLGHIGAKFTEDLTCNAPQFRLFCWQLEAIKDFMDLRYIQLKNTTNF